MKKLVIAAALSAMSAVVSAQQVTVYGTIAPSVVQKEVNGVKTTVQGNGDYLSSSVLGFRGTEDLGGGLKAGFHLQGDLNVGNGTGDGTGGGLTFDRLSFVEIMQNNTGIRVGRLQDIAKDSYGYSAAGTGLTDLSGITGFSTTLGLGSRYPQNTQVETNLGGFRISGSYSNDTTGSAAGDGQGTAASAVGIEGEIVKGVQVIATHATKGDASGNTIGTKVNVGKGEVGFLYATHDDGASSPVKAKAYQVGLTYPMTAGLNVRAGYGKNDSDTNTLDGTHYGVMLEKAFSKRTSVYVAYSDLDLDNGTTNDTKLTIVGMQHKF